AAGTTSRSSCNRFITSSAAKIFIPVRLPPGRDKLETRPSFTGSSGAMKTIGIVVSSRLRCERRRRSYGCNNRDPQASPIVSESRQSIGLGGAVQDRYILAFDKARLLEALSEAAQLVLVQRYGGEEPDHRHRLPLRPRRERPRRRGERNSLNEITSS